MKLTTLDEDLKIHQKLEDEPNDVGGLSAQALKEKFDQAGVTIQKYLNETHLPEEEKAVEDALSEAKAYTDEKAKTMDQGNMKTAVYDSKRRRRDIFDYTDEKVEELQTKKFSGAWVSMGTCYVHSSNNLNSQLRSFYNLTDPDELWSAGDKAFVVPEGGRMAMLLLETWSSRGSNTECYVKAQVNGTERIERTLGHYTNGTWDLETLLIPLVVEEGDKVTVHAYADQGTNSSVLAQVLIRNAGIIIFA